MERVKCAADYFEKRGRMQHCRLCGYVANMDDNRKPYQYKVKHILNCHPHEYQKMKEDQKATRIMTASVTGQPESLQAPWAGLAVFHEILFPSFLHRDFYADSDPTQPQLLGVREVTVKQEVINEDEDHDEPSASQERTVRRPMVSEILSTFQSLLASGPAATTEAFRPNDSSNILASFFTPANLLVPPIYIVENVDIRFPDSIHFELHVGPCEVVVSGRKPRDLLSWFYIVYRRFLAMSFADWVLTSAYLRHLMGYFDSKQDRAWPADLQASYEAKIISDGVGNEMATVRSAFEVTMLQLMRERDMANPNGLKHLHAALLNIAIDCSTFHWAFLNLAVNLRSVYPQEVHFSPPCFQLRS